MTLEQYMTKLNVRKNKHNINWGYAIPEELRCFLNKYENIELPFGIIFDFDTMQEISQKPPFNNEWLVFGRDKYFSFHKEICTIQQV